MNRTHHLEVPICIGIALVGTIIEYWASQVGFSTFTYAVILGD